MTAHYSVWFSDMQGVCLLQQARGMSGEVRLAHSIHSCSGVAVGGRSGKGVLTWRQTSAYHILFTGMGSSPCRILCWTVGTRSRLTSSGQLPYLPSPSWTLFGHADVLEHCRNATRLARVKTRGVAKTLTFARKKKKRGGVP
jgi:hypothetical protein